MSHEPSHSTETLPPPESQAEEGIAIGKILAVGIGALVLFTAGGYVSYRILDRSTRELQPEGPIAAGKEIGKEEIGIVDQPLFETDRRLARFRKEKLDRLSSYGWIDREKGIIHVPIEKAMEEMAQESQR